MRKNTWVFYFFIVLFTALLSVNLVWRFTPVKAEIRDQLKERLDPLFGESFVLHDFSLGFGYISFYDISVGSASQKYLLQIDELQIGFSMHKLLLHQLDPLQVIETITLKEPHLIFWTGEKQQNTTQTDSLDLSRMIGGFRKLGEIDRIFIKQGDIQWAKNSDSLTTLTTGLDGVLIVSEESEVLTKLQGCLFDSPNRDLKISGKIYLERHGWDMIATVADSRLDHGLPFLNSRAFSIKDAQLAGQLHFTCQSYNVMDLDIEGELRVENMQALSFGQKISTNPFRILFDGQRMVLTPVAGTAQDGRFVLNGNLGEVFHPGVYFSIDFDNYSARHIAISAPILELLNQGTLQGHLNLRGPKNHIVITGQIYSTRLQYAIAPFYRSSLEFTFEDKIWKFLDIQTHSIGLDHRGTGEIDFNSMKMWLNIASRRHQEPGLFPIIDKLNDTEMHYSTTMEGDFASLTFIGRVRGSLYNDADSLLLMDAAYKLVDDCIEVQSVSSRPETFSLHARASNLWEDPTFDICEVKSLPLSLLSSASAMHWLGRRFKTDFYFSGPVNFPSAKIKLISRTSDEDVFNLEGSMINMLDPGRKFTGSFSFLSKPNPISGRLFVADKLDRAEITIRAPGIANGNLTVGYADDGPFAGRLAIDSLNVKDYLARFPELFSAVDEGRIGGAVEFSGTKGSPEIAFDFEGQQFIINRNGYYNARLQGQMNSRNLYFEQAWIKNNERSIFNADFSWNLATDQLEAVFEGEKIESNFIATTLFKDPNLVRGDLRYQIAMEGPATRPLISGSLVMRDGELSNRGFKNLHINFEDSIPSPATLSQIDRHLFKILNFIYVDKKDYTIEANGLLAVSEKGPVDLHLNVKGNILAELSEIIDFFQNPNCIGEMDLHITGSRENPHLSAALVNIYTGSVDFYSVLPQLRDLKAEIELKDGERFIHIKNLEGKLDNRFARISNVRPEDVPGIELQPWNFEDLGIDFGILVLETDERGIPLSIPGLMNPGDIGYFATAGMTPEEKFYFAGPVDLPHVRGRGTINECLVTFPFLISEEEVTEGETKVVDFLENIEWDVIVKAGLSSRYFVDIPAVIGKVYLDLNIDEVSEGLHFTGRLIDESFRTEGEVVSTRGRVEYLDLNFRVERFGAVFNRVELFPEVYGRAWTTLRDSTNFPKDIYLELYAIDPETKQEVSRGRWEDFRFKLVSSDPTIGETQEQVLADLGYSMDNISNKAGNVGLTLTENYLIRRLVRPLERKLERGLRLDYVRLRSNITSNLFYYGFQDRLKFLENPNNYRSNLNNNFDPALLLLQSSEITLGKYLIGDIYLTYSGQLVSVYDESKLGLNHRFGLEYRLLRNLLLEFEYDKFQFNPEYYSRNVLQDWRIRLRHSFNF